MSRNQRLALVAATIVVAVGAFVIAKPGDDDDEQQATTAAQTEVAPDTETTPRTETEAKPAIPKVTRIEVKGGQPVGGVEEITVKRGATVRFAVSSDDTSDEVHVHGYDLSKDMAPGQPVKFAFKANLEGVFEAELEGTHVQILTLKVEPN